jgi:NADP-dependent 3-hydroxy acid dehydrogenase YdfG
VKSLSTCTEDFPRADIGCMSTAMTKTIVVCGHGPGISDAVARRFGKEGFAVALVARNAERLDAAATKLSEAGIKAKAFPCDMGNTEAVRTMLREVKASLGSITVLHWNGYTHGAGDLTKASPDELHSVLGSSVYGLLAGVQEALPDLKANGGAVLVTGGGFAFYDSKIDAMAAQFGVMGLAVAKAAQHKTVGLLQQKLPADGVYVGEVVVMATVKGTAFDRGNGTLESSRIAEKFWELFTDRKETSVTIA